MYDKLLENIISKNLRLLNEHLDTVDNLSTVIKIIREDWESPDDYWHIDITSRRKDIINNKFISPYYSKVTKDGKMQYFKRVNTSRDKRDKESSSSKNFVGYAIVKGNTVEEAINSLLNPTIHFTKWASEELGMKTYKTNDGAMKGIIDVCTQFYARAYISMNKRSYQETTTNLANSGYGNYGIDSFLFSNESQKKIKGNEKFKKRPWTIIDFDIDDEEVEKEFENYLKQNGVIIRYKLKSHNGTHYLLNYKDMATARKINLDLDRFDMRSKTFGVRHNTDKAVNIDNDNKMLLYSPCGKWYEFSDSYIKEEKMAKDKFLNEIVRKSIINVLLEAERVDISSTMGSKGHLTNAELLDAAKVFEKTYKLIEQVKQKYGLRGLNLDKIFKDDYGYRIWKNYVRSMFGEFRTKDKVDKEKNPVVDQETGETVKEPILKGFKTSDINQEFYKEAVPFFKWIKSIKTGKRKDFTGNQVVKKIFAVGDDMIVGHWIGGYFIANSISTTGIRGLITLLREISQYDNVIFAVTLDMAKQLERVGMYTDGGIHETPFGDRMVQKKIFATSKDALGKAVQLHNLESMVGFRDLGKKRRKK